MRKALLWVGTILMIWANPIRLANANLIIPGYVVLLYVLAWSMIGVGCFLWVKGKNRHWAFTFWCLLAPFGYLGIALLKDKSQKG